MSITLKLQTVPVGVLEANPKAAVITAGKVCPPGAIASKKLEMTLVPSHASVIELERVIPILEDNTG